MSLLDKYFSAYTGKRDDLRANIGRFDGSIDHLECNFFAGIKVYPPLGFDPWPRDEAELEKVRELYRCARDNGIPMTTHGGRGGFKGVGRTELNECTAVSKWAAVLAEFPTLKLNLAHFPMNLSERRRRDKTLQLVLDRDSVYVDVSCRATNATYYTELRRLLDRLSDEEREKLRSRILFGSDFAVNLLRIESYNQYVSIFSRTDALTPDEKRAFCSGNPERFLFTHAE